MGGWRGTLGANDLSPRPGGIPMENLMDRLGWERCLREAWNPTKPDVIRECQEVYLVSRSLDLMEVIRFRSDKHQGEFFCGNAPFGGGEKPESGPNYLSTLIHVCLQAACGMVTCSGLASIVLEMIAQNPVFHFAFRVQLG